MNEKIVFCQECGSKMESGSCICSNCGHKYEGLKTSFQSTSNSHLGSSNNFKKTFVIFTCCFSVVIIVLAILLFNSNKKTNELSDEISSQESQISELESKLETAEATNLEITEQAEKYKSYYVSQLTPVFSKSVTTTTKNGSTTTSVKYIKDCDEEVDVSDDGEIIKKCGLYIIVKTFNGYVVGHSWGEGSVGDEVKGNIYWGIGWEDWLIDCKKVNVKIEKKGDWDEISEWIKENC